MRQTHDISLVTSRSSWFQKVKKFMFYFTRNENQEDRRCVSAFAPSFAVTYAHSTNSTLFAPKRDQNGKITEHGSEFKVYSFDSDDQGKIRKEVETIQLFL
jgi:hypothetical protein